MAKDKFYLIFIIGFLGLSLVTLGVLTYVKNKPPVESPTVKATKLMQEANNNFAQAKEILSKEETTEKNQKKGKELIDQAIGNAQKATELDANNPDTWHFAGNIYYELISINQKAAPLAEEALKKAISLSPKDAKLYEALANVYITTKQYEKAEAMIQKSLELNPNRANPYFKLGNIYKDLGDKKKAKEYYLKAQELTPSDQATNSAMIQAQINSLERITPQPSR